MKTLLLLRHAKSSWKDDSQDDFDRPLNERGKYDAPRVGEVLAEHALRPDLVLCSSAKRARKTADKVLEASGYASELRLLDDLYLASPSAYLAHLKKLPNQISCVLLVGHNPGLEELLSEMTGQHRHLPTAALVQIELDIDAWQELAPNRSGRIARFWQPREGDAEQ